MQEETTVNLGTYATIVRSERIPKKNEPRTYVLTGSSRGGTSALGYIFSRKGIDLAAGDRRNHEDPNMVSLISRGKIDLPRVREYIAERNAERNVWGFKLPAAAMHLEVLEAELRNPVFVYIYRNPVSVASSILRRVPKYEKGASGLSKALRHANDFYHHMSRAVAEMEASIVLIEYEKLHHEPAATCGAMFDALDWPTDGLQGIAAELKKPGYKVWPNPQ